MTGMDNSYGLIIGISEYQYINKLPSAVINDAEDIYNLLTNPNICGYPEENVKTLLNREASHEGILKALSYFANTCNSNSTIFIYISSHGGRIETGPNIGEYLLPVDTILQSENTLAQTAISGDIFTNALKAIPAKKMVVIFDCCHSAGIGEPKELSGTVIKSGLTENYYESLKYGHGRVIIASSRSDELSWIMPNASNSLFTQHLLSGLKGGALGVGGVIRILDLFSYVQPLVKADKPEQHPVLKAEIEDNFPVALYLGGKEPSILSDASSNSSPYYGYDVFISYRHHKPEMNWVRNILLPNLEAAGLKVCIDFRDFRLGAPLVTEMARGVEESKYTLAILSPAYLESSFTELENILAEHLGLENGQRRLITIMREDCVPRLGIRARLWLDMKDDNDLDRNLKRLIYELKQEQKSKSSEVVS